MTVTHGEEVTVICDGCGVTESDARFAKLVPVSVEVNYGGRLGRRDDYDYCSDCLAARAERLLAVGSRSLLVGGDGGPLEGDYDPN